MEKLLEIAINAAIEASESIMKIYETDDFGIQSKSDHSPLTKADIASHNVIMSHLESTSIPVLSEEGRSIPYEERKTWNRLWIVDPIDGTKEFIKRNGEFTVNIALIENQQPIAGVVLVPALNELYFSSSKHGSFKTSWLEKGASLQDRISKSQQLPLTQENRSYTVVASRSHLSGQSADFIEALKTKHGKIVMLSKGSSLKLCMVAEGSADIYPRFAPTMEWDTAAGQAICNHAGATVINWDTQESLLYNRENLLNPWFVVERS